MQLGAGFAKACTRQTHVMAGEAHLRAFRFVNLAAFRTRLAFGGAVDASLHAGHVGFFRFRFVGGHQARDRHRCQATEQ